MSNTKHECHMCHSTKFWLSIHSRLICAACHPPADPALVKEWIDRATDNVLDMDQEYSREVA